MRRLTPDEIENARAELRAMRETIESLKASVPPSFAREYVATMDKSLAEVERVFEIGTVK
ncbi:MAG: hypothetical protein F4020_01810 [Gammaproteobacteria bacterium]|nr:hypothetical protein [Gammaproteobacteria bacterium]MYK68330.1 hypothetical protein [Gammaproteobacteria bacterium]